jgi:hypothetical protein
MITETEHAKMKAKRLTALAAFVWFGSDEALLLLPAIDYPYCEGSAGLIRCDVTR